MLGYWFVVVLRWGVGKVVEGDWRVRKVERMVVRMEVENKVVRKGDSG